MNQKTHSHMAIMEHTTMNYAVNLIWSHARRGPKTLSVRGTSLLLLRCSRTDIKHLGKKLLLDINNLPCRLDSCQINAELKHPIYLVPCFPEKEVRKKPQKSNLWNIRGVWRNSSFPQVCSPVLYVWKGDAYNCGEKVEDISVNGIGEQGYTAHSCVDLSVYTHIHTCI